MKWPDNPKPRKGGSKTGMGWGLGGGWYKETAWGHLTADRAGRAKSCEKPEPRAEVGGRPPRKDWDMGRQGAKRGLGRRGGKGRGDSPSDGFSRSSCLD